MVGIAFEIVGASDTRVVTDVGGEGDGHREVGLCPATVFDWGPEVWNMMIGRVFADVAFIVEIRIATEEQAFAIDWRIARIGDGLEFHQHPWRIRREDDTVVDYVGNVYALHLQKYQDS